MPADNVGIRVGYLAGTYPGKLGHLHSPRPGRVPPGPFGFMPYALDNGRFAAGDKWSECDWLRMLGWAQLCGQPPLWAIVPDIVGDRAGTLLEWKKYAEKVASYGWPLAFAVQDGMVKSDVPRDASVVFVGGSTKWKWKTAQMWCAEFPRVHIGRVNTYRLLWRAHDARAESCDGTGWSKCRPRDFRDLLAYLAESTNAKERPLQLPMELIA